VVHTSWRLTNLLMDGYDLVNYGLILHLVELVSQFLHLLVFSSCSMLLLFETLGGV
jgi:hypothetical protein